MKIEIKACITGSILFECESDSIKIAVELAVSKGADLLGADLRGAYLQWADLLGADLRGADLRGADLRGAYLLGADLLGADLLGADLRGADLRRADLRGADLRGADLRRADLQGADLQGADLQGADLQGADLNGEKLDKAPIMLQGLKWDILISKKKILIGCQMYEAEKWFNFKDDEIADMHVDALTWWNEHKKFIKSAWELHCKD